MRPKLPAADRIGAYLRKIDETRIYSNFGPLARSLEDRLGTHFGLSGENVCSLANGTLGLTLALMAQGARSGTLCLMPSWTFVASAHAALMAGLFPYFVDVNPISWALDPNTVAEAIRGAPADVGAVMPVVPYGCPIDTAAWDAVQLRCGVPVAIDAAAGFDTVVASDAPVIVSLHATKVLGAGEGAFVISKNPQLIEAIRARANFGFSGSREAIDRSLNAKLSEYHAAVAQAALDEWPEARDDWMKVARSYREVLAISNRVQLQSGFGQSWITSTCVLQINAGDVDQLEHRLANARLETRRWWGAGAHAHPATKDLPRADLDVTQRLAKTTIAVPFSRDLAIVDIERIGERISSE